MCSDPISSDNNRLSFKKRCRSFFDGCTGPSWVGTLGALAICLLLYVLCMTFVTADRFARAPGRFAESSDDEFPFVKARAMRIAAHGSETDPYRVILIGDSAISEAITSPQNLENRIAKKLGHRVALTPLMAGGLNQLEGGQNIRDAAATMRGEVMITEFLPYNLAMVLNREAYDKALTSIGIETPDMAQGAVCSRVTALSPFLPCCNRLSAGAQLGVRTLPAGAPRTTGSST